MPAEQAAAEQALAARCEAEWVHAHALAKPKQQQLCCKQTLADVQVGFGAFACQRRTGLNTQRLQQRTQPWAPVGLGYAVGVNVYSAQVVVVVLAHMWACFFFWGGLVCTMHTMRTIFSAPLACQPAA